MPDLAAMIATVREEVKKNEACAKSWPTSRAWHQPGGAGFERIRNLRAAQRLLEALADRNFAGKCMYEAVYTIWWHDDLDKSSDDLLNRRFDAFLADLLAQAEGGSRELGEAR